MRKWVFGCDTRSVLRGHFLVFCVPCVRRVFVSNPPIPRGGRRLKHSVMLQEVHKKGFNRRRAILVGRGGVVCTIRTKGASTRTTAALMNLMLPFFAFDFVLSIIKERRAFHSISIYTFILMECVDFILFTTVVVAFTRARNKQCYVRIPTRKGPPDHSSFFFRGGSNRR